MQDPRAGKTDIDFLAWLVRTRSIDPSYKALPQADIPFPDKVSNGIDWPAQGTTVGSAVDLYSAIGSLCLWDTDQRKST